MDIAPCIEPRRNQPMIDLNKRRIEAGLNIRQVAQAAGLGYATVHAIMTGQCVNPKMATYEAIVRAINKAKLQRGKSK
jgi:predicted transcriptional regulator